MKTTTNKQIEPGKVLEGKIINELLTALDITAYVFSNKLGYKSSMSIYSIQRGTRAMTTDMRNRIMLTFPEVNEEFLNNGNGNPLKYIKAPSIKDVEILNKLGKNKISIDDFVGIPSQINRLESKIDEILKIMKNNIE